jgi:hypothetical protein
MSVSFTHLSDYSTSVDSATCTSVTDCQQTRIETERTVEHFVLAGTTDSSEVSIANLCGFLLSRRYEFIKAVAVSDGKGGEVYLICRRSLVTLISWQPQRQLAK